MEPISPQPHTDEQTISALKHHQIIAFDKLYDQYAGALYGDIKRTLYKDDVSEEILTEVFKVISLSIHSFDPVKESLFAWALRIARQEISKRKIEITIQEIFLTKM